eukprot:GHVT01093808.1.p1 GENE.GHVT01093808.1~~GHVT01093808.1.p1  ORF type:complete len:121 (+),score=5.05 GHVT01093808.1:786-1148(+)
MEKAELERLRGELEARSRAELNQKLEEVNRYLEEQAQARHHLDSIRENSSVDMRKEFEKNKKDLSVRFEFLFDKSIYCVHFLSPPLLQLYPATQDGRRIHGTSGIEMFTISIHLLDKAIV